MPGTGMTPEGLSPPQTMKFKPSLGERVKLHKGISNILRKMGLKAKLILVQKKTIWNPGIPGVFQMSMENMKITYGFQNPYENKPIF